MAEKMVDVHDDTEIVVTGASMGNAESNLEDSLDNVDLAKYDKESIKSIFRKYDVNGDGVFSADEIGLMMVDFNRANHANVLLRKMMLFSVGLIILLMASNVGTTYMAIQLSKQIKIDDDGVMKQKKSGKILKTNTVSIPMVLNATMSNSVPDVGRRMTSNQDWMTCLTKEEKEDMVTKKQNGEPYSVTMHFADGKTETKHFPGTLIENPNDTGSIDDVFHYKGGGCSIAPAPVRRRLDDAPAPSRTSSPTASPSPTTLAFYCASNDSSNCP